jgi:hypothetical protein
LEPAVLLKVEVELKKIVVADGRTLTGLLQLGGKVPNRKTDTGRDEQVHDPAFGWLGDSQTADGAEKRV